MEAANKTLDITGSESITDIISVGEKAVLDFSMSLNADNEEPVKLLGDAEEYLNDLIENPCEQVGISTGYDRYDFAIGGGLRRSTVNVIAARPKVGKTQLADNIGVHISKNLHIPVLNLDTEMDNKDHTNRIMAMLTEIPIREIETGKFADNPSWEQDVMKAARENKNIPYYYKSIGGVSFEDQMTTIRRWLIKEVGLNNDGSAKDCVVIYDYLKLTNSTNLSDSLKEYQALGFIMTALHDFSLKYKIPILCFCQLNRDGITKESSDTVSQSDRIIWFCSNFSIFKKKSADEIAMHPKAGNRKLVPVLARHGEGLEDGDYINMTMKGGCAKIECGKCKSELENTDKDSKDGFVVDDDKPEGNNDVDNDNDLFL